MFHKSISKFSRIFSQQRSMAQSRSEVPPESDQDPDSDVINENFPENGAEPTDSLTDTATLNEHGNQEDTFPGPEFVLGSTIVDPPEDMDPECAVCLQTCIHPVQLPCGHIFCFLCVKGVANQSKRCALCRQEIPRDFLNNPALVRREDLHKVATLDDGHQWFYEGRNGWWQYDERTSQELEERFKSGLKHFEMLIAGFLYVIDYENMVQVRRNDPTRRRRIKRDSADIPKKGVAGLKFNPSPSGSDSSLREGADGDEDQSRDTGAVGLTRSALAQALLGFTDSSALTASTLGMDSLTIAHSPLTNSVLHSSAPGSLSSSPAPLGTTLQSPGETSPDLLSSPSHEDIASHMANLHLTTTRHIRQRRRHRFSHLDLLGRDRMGFMDSSTSSDDSDWD